MARVRIFLSGYTGMIRAQDRKAYMLLQCLTMFRLPTVGIGWCARVPSGVLSGKKGVIRALYWVQDEGV